MKSKKIVDPGLLSGKEIEIHTLSMKESRNIAQEIRSLADKYESANGKKLASLSIDLFSQSIDYVTEFIPRASNITKEEAERLDFDEVQILFHRFMEVNSGFLRLLGSLGINMAIQPTEENVPQQEIEVTLPRVTQ